MVPSEIIKGRWSDPMSGMFSIWIKLFLIFFVHNMRSGVVSLLFSVMYVGGVAMFLVS